MPKSHPEYDALSAAVCAAPDDDTPRLVLADWLDEHDGSARAAYLRAQVGLARAREVDPGAAAVFDFRMSVQRGEWNFFAEPAPLSPGVATVARFTKQCSAAAKKAEARWAAVRGKRRSGEVYTFERGFPYSIRINDAAHYAAKQPPENLPGFLLALDANGAGFDALLACANFAHVTGLWLGSVDSPDPLRKVGARSAARHIRSLGFFQAAADSGICAAVATQPNWGALAALNVHLGFHEPAVDLPPAFAGATHLRGLTELDLHGDVTGAGVGHLAALGLPRLRRLRLNTHSVDADGARALAGGAFPELRALELSRNQVGNAGAAALAACRAGLPHLVALDLGGNVITDPDAVADLIAGPGLPSLAGLDLSSARVGDLDPARLAAEGRGPGLRLLSLNGCALTPRAVAALAGAPALRGLVGLNLGYNEFGDAGAEALARAAGWDRLTCLELGHNGITGDGVKALVAWSGLKNLSCLDLCHNPIGLDGAKALAGCAALKKCRKIVVPYNRTQLPADGLDLLRATFGRRIATN